MAFDLRNYLTENKLTETSKLLNERIEQRYEVGDEVELTDNAIQNYGSKYRGKTFRVEDVYTSDREHRGYDSSSQAALYSLQGLNFDVYDWELQ